VGDLGIIHTGGNNSLNGKLIDYLNVQLLRKTEKGLDTGDGTPDLYGLAGLCQVPLANIQLGALLLRPGKLDVVPVNPRLQFNSIFKNFDCYVTSVEVPEDLSPPDLWIRTKAPPIAEMPAIWSFRTHRTTIFKEKATSSERVQLFRHRQRPQDAPRILALSIMVPCKGTPLKVGSAVNVMIEITIDPAIEHPHSYI
jgi:hypothetical protein